MKEQGIYHTQLRLNLKRAEHKEVHDYLLNLPSGRSISALVVDAVLLFKNSSASSQITVGRDIDESEELEMLLRRVIREELHGKESVSVPVQKAKEDEVRKETVTPEEASEPMFGVETLLDIEELVDF